MSRILVAVVAIVIVLTSGYLIINSNEDKNSEYATEFSTDTHVVECQWFCPTFNDEDPYAVETFEFNIPNRTPDDVQRRANDDIIMPSALVDPSDDSVVKIATYLNDMTEGLNEIQRAQIILRFVQDVIDYEFDTIQYNVSEYWATPYETIYNGCGDCEDTAVLMCSIALAMNIDCALVGFNNHMGAALSISGLTNPSFTHNDKDFIYCETAADSKIPIGTLAPEYSIDEANISFFFSEDRNMIDDISEVSE